MNVLLATGIYPPDIGGPATYTRALASALNATGHEVRVVAYGSAGTSEPWPVSRVSRAGNVVLRYFRYAHRVWHEARAVDVVYLQGPVSEGFPGALACKFLKKKYVLKVVGDYAWEVYQRKGGTQPLEAFAGSKGLVQRMESWVARGAERVIVPSFFLKKIVAKWGVAEDRISVIYNALEPLAYPEHEISRAQLNISPAASLLLAVMRAVPWKNGELLLETLANSPDHAQLVVAGDGPSLGAWKKHAEKLGVSSRVTFLGQVDQSELARWYAAADAFVLPSTYEGFPHVVIEAVQAGLPCAVSEYGGNPETKELYPDHVTVIPLDNQAAWVNFFSQTHVRKSPAPARPFSRVAEETAALLKNVCAS